MTGTLSELKQKKAELDKNIKSLIMNFITENEIGISVSVSTVTKELNLGSKTIVGIDYNSEIIIK